MELKTIKEGSSTPPKSRLADAESARAILAPLIKADEQASLKRSRIQGVIDGNQPNTEAELRKKSQGNNTNVNWGGAAAKISEAKTPYFDLLTGSPCMIDGSCSYGDEAQQSEWSQKISKRFHQFLFKWKGFIYNELLHQSQLITHGIGPCNFRNPKDWRYTALKRRAILVPSDASADMSSNEIVFVRDSMRAHELFQFIKNKESAAKMGWKVDATVKAIQEASEENTNDNYEAMQEQFKNNALGWGYKTKTIQLAHAYVTEFSGKVSHHIFTQSGDHKEYLYSKIGQYDSLAEVLWVCFEDIGNGDFHSQRGLGSIAAQFGEAQNKLNNALFSNAMIGSTPMFIADSPEAVDRLANFEVGAMRVIPSGLTLQQVNLGTGVQAALTVSQQLSMIEASQTGGYRNQALAPRGVERTAKEVSAEVSNSSKLSNTKVAFYLLQKDDLIEEVYKRVTRKGVLESDPGGKEALRFVKDLLAQGVPQKAIEEFVPKVTRPIGSGSEADRVQRMEMIGQFINDMPERKRAQYVRDAIAYAGGSRDLADRYGPDLEPQGPSVQEKFAMLENVSLMQGADPGSFFSPDDNHAIHFEAHRDYVTNLLQSDGDPQQVAAAMESFGPHMAAHLKGIEGDPTRRHLLDTYKQEFSEIMKAADQVAQGAEAMEQVQNPERDPAILKAQAEIQLKTQKASSDMQIKAAKAQQMMAIKDATAAQSLRNNGTKKQAAA